MVQSFHELVSNINFKSPEEEMLFVCKRPRARSVVLMGGWKRVILILAIVGHWTVVSGSPWLPAAGVSDKPIASAIGSKLPKMRTESTVARHTSRFPSDHSASTSQAPRIKIPSSVSRLSVQPTISKVPGPSTVSTPNLRKPTTTPNPTPKTTHAPKTALPAFSDGDSLLCYESITWFQTVGCLGANTSRVFPTNCAKQPEEIWILHNSTSTVKGLRTFRLKSHPHHCLSLTNDSAMEASMELCDPESPWQLFRLVPFIRPMRKGSPRYKLFHIRNYHSNEMLIFDIKHGRITRSSPSIIDQTYLPHPWDKSKRRYYCDKWLWVSEVERKAHRYRKRTFHFPINGKRNPERRRYHYAWIDQMMESTPAYPPVVISQETCSRCEVSEEPCDCFPIDYELTTTRIAEKTITLNLSMIAGGVGFEYRPSRNRIPTGMYARPWEPITIRVDRFDRSKITIRGSLFLNADLSADECWTRPPQITVQRILDAGMNQFRSPYGGPLTLEVIGNDTKLKSIKLTIRAYPMASFVLGKTTSKDWTRELTKEPNWVTFQGRYVIGLDMKRPYRNVSYGQIMAMVERFDLMLENSYLLSGYDTKAKTGSIHAVPQGWHWWTRDVSYRGYMYAGNPVTVNMFSEKEITLSMESWELWGFGHEFAHNLQTPCYSHELGAEVTNNIYCTFHMAYFCGDGKQTVDCKLRKYAGHDFLDIFLNRTVPALARNKTYEQLKPLEALVFWVQIFAIYGYEPFRNMNRRFRERFVAPKDDLCRGDGKQPKLDAVYETMCEMTSVDMTSHFDAYRIPLTKMARKRVAEKKYPRPEVELSKVRVKTGTPLGWAKGRGKVPPSYALPPFKKLLDMQ